MTQEFVISYLKLKRAAIPGVVEFDVIRVDESQFLI
jgi:hypothetical protein